jgi:GNAT superfamily N-acetyltransferase
LSRVSVLVRDAQETDVSVLCHLWSAMAGTTPPPIPEQVAPDPDVVVRQALARVQRDQAARILVAEVEGSVVGCAYLRSEQVSPLHDDEAVRVSHLEVEPGYGRHDVDLALVESALTWAEQRGATTLTAATPSNDRDANRFLARLGLAQVGALRTVPVAALRARVPHNPSALVRDPARLGRSLGQVVAARRSQRRARGVRPVGAAD